MQQKRVENESTHFMILWWHTDSCVRPSSFSVLSELWIFLIKRTTIVWVVCVPGRCVCVFIQCYKILQKAVEQQAQPMERMFLNVTLPAKPTTMIFCNFWIGEAKKCEMFPAPERKRKKQHPSHWNGWQHLYLIFIY